MNTPSPSRAQRRLPAFLALACACAAAPPLSASPPPTTRPITSPICVLEREATLPLRDDGGYLSVPVTIDGHDASMIVDTGSEGSLMTPEGASALRLASDPTRHTVIRGPNGMARSVMSVQIHELTLGGRSLGAGTMPVGALPGAPMIRPPILGLIGADILADHDVEFDVPHRRLTLWRVHLGASVCRQPPAWVPAGHWQTLDAQLQDGRLSVAFTLDGHTGRALLDSGARSHIVSTDFAHRLGLSDAQLARDPGGVTAGVDLTQRIYHWHRFLRFGLGREIWAHPVLTVAPVHDRTDMLLGADWFAHHAVWLSYATRHAYVRLQ